MVGSATRAHWFPRRPANCQESPLTVNLKGKLAIAATAVTVAAVAGGAYAATQQSGATGRQTFLNDVAKRLHVTPQQLDSALKGAALDRLNAAVAAGRLTQAQADALRQRIEKRAGRHGLFGHRWFFHRLMGSGGPVGGKDSRRRFGCPGRGKLIPHESWRSSRKGSSNGPAGWAPAAFPPSID